MQVRGDGGEMYRGHEEEIGEESERGQEAIGEDGQTGEGVDSIVDIPAVHPATCYRKCGKGVRRGDIRNPLPKLQLTSP